MKSECLRCRRYEDGGRVRPVLHRASTVEIIVPYGDPRSPFHKKCAFDVVDYGLGFSCSSLELGCDCLGHVSSLLFAVILLIVSLFTPRVAAYSRFLQLTNGMRTFVGHCSHCHVEKASSIAPRDSCSSGGPDLILSCIADPLL